MFNIFGKQKAHVNFIYFQTADGCYRMVPTTPVWEPLPIITLPLVFPTEAKDWMNQELTDDSLVSKVETRTFRLEAEEFLPDSTTVIYSYREVR